VAQNLCKKRNEGDENTEAGRYSPPKKENPGVKTKSKGTSWFLAFNLI